MNIDNFSQFFSKKAYEISYAALRIGSVVTVQSFVERLSDQAFSLVDLAARGKYSECKNIAGSMECLLRLGGDTDIVHPRNVLSMVQEIGQFNSAIAEYEKLAEQPTLVSLDESFSKMPVSSPEKKESGSDFVFSAIPNQETNYKALEYENPEPQKENNHGVAKSAIGSPSGRSPAGRQSAILEIIRQSGNPPAGQAGCRLKDIQDSLHEGSERTIRYDLQDLIERGLVERIGSGGPSTYYKVLQIEGEK